MKRLWLWGALGVAGLAVAVILWMNRPYSYHGALIEPAQPAPALDLTGPGGQPFSLAGVRGSVTLIFFGYTSCPDVCPTTMTLLRQVMADLGGAAANVRVLLVTVDPLRDTPERLAGYLKPFGSNFYGLSGSEAQLLPAWQAYGVTRIIRPVGSDPQLYTVDHSARLYLVDKHGLLRLTYPYGTPAADIRQDVQAFLKEQ